MSSLNMFLAPTTAISTTATSSSSIPTTTTSCIVPTRARRVQTFATAAKGSGKSSSEEEGIWGFLMGAMVKDQLVETDPILQKVEGKSGTTTVSGKKTTTSAAPAKKSDGGGFGGFGGLFAKK